MKRKNYLSAIALLIAMFCTSLVWVVLFASIMDAMQESVRTEDIASETRQAQLHTETRAKIDEIFRRVAVLEHLDVSSRMSRIEQSLDMLTKLIWAVLAGIGTLSTAAIKDWIDKRAQSQKAKE